MVRAEEPSREKAPERGARGTRYMARPDVAQLAEIGRLIDATFPLKEVAAAEARLENAHVRGKIVLKVAA